MRPWLVFVLLMLPSAAFAAHNIDSLLRKLDQVLADRQEYVDAKLARIGALKAQVRHTSGLARFEVYTAIAREYEKFVYDSAAVYISKMETEALKLQDQRRLSYARMKRGFIMVSSGMFNEALDTLLALKPTLLADSGRREYYAVLSRCYFDLVDFNGDDSYTKLYNEIGVRYVDSALHYAVPESVPYYALKAMRGVRTRTLDEAERDLRYMLAKFKLSYTDLAIATNTIAYVFMLQGKEEEAIAKNIESSIADNMASTKETLAVLTLAELMHKRGELARAHDYVKVAMDDANFYGARHRKVRVAAIYPIIEGNRLEAVERQRRALFGYAIAITCLSLVVIGFVIIAYKQSQRIRIANQNTQEANRSLHEANQLLQEVNKHLVEANKIKEEYIGYYFNINSEYLMKIAAFKQAIDNKLMAKKFDDIRFVVSNINLKKEREELYLSFDKVFLKLFPEFVDTFNSFFKEEDRIVVKDGQLLNAELRIFALIRMGIHETEKIAKILDYSINTIYNYKARIKSKSVLPNEEFETRIMQIKAI